MAAQPKQARALKTRDDILRAAATTFDELGYKGASMREIMRRAGVTLGALYFHFENKEALAQAVMLAQTGELTANLDSEGVQRIVDFSMTWAHQLNVSPLIRAAVRLAVEQQSLGIGDDISYGDFEAIFVGWLETAKENGELAPGVVPGHVAQFLVGAFTGIQHYAQLAGSLPDLPTRVERMWQLLLPGIATSEVVERIVVDPSRGCANNHPGRGTTSTEPRA
ncbi:ScbR family autoregulator-binding transcription factor [Streptomyces lancefieldiae]|uniref:ScbR family autoregulator-binding transcription factor n=1 Tax=Streptomyces lancefieldiae TaxID=3075520 RepID=A0ABU3AZK6_9ACTN|nr:ScbR family autoregulator-binding transcription factor [Streptomyces sp. DSM 40712]MDT0615363.1 ScbR family autoregulator-binding transcription factor [Streptomyces sp. DSM 40712]